MTVCVTLALQIHELNATQNTVARTDDLPFRRQFYFRNNVIQQQTLSLIRIQPTQIVHSHPMLGSRQIRSGIQKRIGAVRSCVSRKSGIGDICAV